MFTAVRTTGIYCRPGCSGRPLKENTVLFDLAAEAEGEGFRACHVCRPYQEATPAFMSGPDIVCRGVGMILDGLLDRHREDEMAGHLGVSSRHLRRLFREHLGVTPTELAKSTRAHFARRLIDDTDLTITEIAFAAGFGSVRQMNRVLREVFRSTPSELRAKRRRTDRLAADGGLALRLPYDGPFDWEAMIAFLQARAIRGVEYVTNARYSRTVLVDGDPGVLEVEPLDDQHLKVTAHLPHWEGLIHIARRTTAIFGLTMPTDLAREHLATDPILGPLVRTSPGIRVPGTWDAFEIGVLAIIRQENPLEIATELASDLTKRYGRIVPGLTELGLSRLFPEPPTLARASFVGINVSEQTRRTLTEFSAAVSVGEVVLDPNGDLNQLLASLLAIPGFELATAYEIAFRLGFQDVLPPGETQVDNVLGPIIQSVAAVPVADAWRPWRSLATAYLLTSTSASRSLRVSAS